MATYLHVSKIHSKCVGFFLFEVIYYSLVARKISLLSSDLHKIM